MTGLEFGTLDGLDFLFAADMRRTTRRGEYYMGDACKRIKSICIHESLSVCFLKITLGNNNNNNNNNNKAQNCPKICCCCNVLMR
jgi:hypothetical protein